MDLFRSGLRAYAFAFGTNNTLDKIMEIADVTIDPDDELFKPLDPGKPAKAGNWWELIKNTAKNGWNKLISINPLGVLRGFQAFISRKIGDSIDIAWNFNWQI